MSEINIVFYVYAALLLLGGIFGYSKAKSAPSLIAGIVAAVLAAIAGYLEPLHHRTGTGLGGLVALVLLIFFAGRYSSTKKAMPAIPMMVFSLIVLVIAIVSLVMRSHVA